MQSLYLTIITVTLPFNRGSTVSLSMNHFITGTYRPTHIHLHSFSIKIKQMIKESDKQWVTDMLNGAESLKRQVKILTDALDNVNLQLAQVNDIVKF